MNDYITKPIDPEAMFATLRLYYAGNGKKAPPPAPAPAEASGQLSIAGIDSVGGIRRVMGNTALYMDLLKRYSEGQRDAIGKVSAALGSGDRPLAERLAHTLKGVSGNIGASEVQEIAAKLEAAIRDSAPEAEIAELSRRLSEVLAGVIGAIDRALAEAAEAAKGRPTPGKKDGVSHSIEEIAAKLLHYAEESDGEALDYLDSVRDELSELCDREKFEKLEASIRSFDFSAAIEVLKTLPGCPVGRG
jgi:HPt (histidine-containing phosphotransfer) domain-containing protein